MIQTSPSLSTLKLEMCLKGYHKLVGLDLENFFETLGATLPNLRHFEHRSHSSFDLQRVLDPTRGPSTVRSFFLQHPNIETLALDWSPMPSLADREVEGVHSLFPALRRFSGSTELSSAIVGSPIRLRLESLKVLRSPIINSSNSYTMVADSIIELPQLRHLSFPAEEEYRNRYWRHLDEHSLKKYFCSASELASLEINGSGRLKEFNKSVQAAFDYAPNLKQLKLNLPEKYATLSSDLVGGRKSNTDTRELCQLVSRLARACPLLERITSSGITTPHLVYRLERNHEGLLEKITISAGRDYHTLPVA
ncbi:hypothetical protein FS749_011335 [Ceratobasidium sp. UAMH 11750]|nr:hypothetical protein FS749_011335 [Ceratobasidium sp. UAMH 11750]